MKRLPCIAILLFLLAILLRFIYFFYTYKVWEALGAQETDVQTLSEKIVPVLYTWFMSCVIFLAGIATTIVAMVKCKPVSTKFKVASFLLLLVFAVLFFLT